MSHNSEVSVESLEDATEHSHEEDLEIANNKSTNFKWPDEATKIVKNNLHALRKIERKSVFPSECVRNTHELRRKVAEFLKEPESDTEPYVPFHEIEDSDPSKEPRFTIIFASKKNLDKLKADRVLQTDATYRLNWMGYPVFVIGKRIFSI